MTDKAVTFSGQAQAGANPGQPGAAVPGGQGLQPADGAQPQYVTIEKARQLAAEATEEALRKSQSLSDKSESRLRREFGEKLNSFEATRAMLKNAGVEITPEVEAKVRQNMLTDVMSSQGAAAQQPAAEPNTPASANPVDPTAISQAALEIMQAAGVYVEDDDPEAGQINHSSPLAFLKSVEAAVAAKRARVGAAVSGVPQPAGGVPQPGRTPTSAGPAGPAPGLMQQYQQEVQRAGLSLDERISIRTKYRRLGLNI